MMKATPAMATAATNSRSSQILTAAGSEDSEGERERGGAYIQPYKNRYDHCIMHHSYISIFQLE